MTNATLALSLRGGRIEGWHRGSVAITDPDGRLLFSAGDPTMSTYLRSSIKMIQAIPVVRSGAADRFSFSNAELAICCASHDGAGYHLQTVSGMLATLGLTESALRCGGHDPHDRTELGRLVCDHRKPGALYNNCSGKHTGMLAACLAKGWPIENYLAADHPLQQWILELMAEYTGVPTEQIDTATDGCSLPTFYVPLLAASRTAARFVADAIAGDQACSRIMQAVAAHPEMINAHGGFDTELVRVMAGAGIAKRGAMAIFVVGVNSRKHGPIGVAVKLEEGDMAPMPPAVMRALEIAEIFTPEQLAQLERFRRIELKNWNGISVGEIRGEYEMERQG